MILALVIFTPINLTVVWLQLGAGLLFVGFLGFLPQLARESPWKAILLVLVVSLIGISLYIYGHTTLPIALIQTPTLIAYGLLYAWKGSDLLQAYQRQRQRLIALSLTTVLAIVCFSLAGWYILHYTVVSLPDQGNLFPLVLLISPYTFLIQMEGSRPGSRAS
jgi:hypothetical protein